VTTETPQSECGVAAMSANSEQPDGTLSDRSRLIVTIDGPAGSGKTSAAHSLAKRLGLESLDTGAMYRAIAMETIAHGVDPESATEVARIARASTLQFDFEQLPPRLIVNGVDPGGKIRTAEVNRIVSTVAQHPEVRAILVEAQRAVAVEHPRLVTEGRDQGSVVFPDAECRFYLDASATVRARRRAAEERAAGHVVDETSILHSIEARDGRDQTRADGPLRVPDGAIRIETGELSLESVVDQLAAVVLACTRQSG
jgi:cytidylate kinase